MLFPILSIDSIDESRVVFHFVRFRADFSAVSWHPPSLPLPLSNVCNLAVSDVVYSFHPPSLCHCRSVVFAMFYPGPLFFDLVCMVSILPPFATAQAATFLSFFHPHSGIITNVKTNLCCTSHGFHDCIHHRSSKSFPPAALMRL